MIFGLVKFLPPTVTYTIVTRTDSELIICPLEATHAGHVRCGQNQLQFR